MASKNASLVIRKDTYFDKVITEYPRHRSRLAQDFALLYSVLTELEDIEALYDLADALFDQKWLEEALKTCDTILSLDLDSHRGRLMKAATWNKKAAIWFRQFAELGEQGRDDELAKLLQERITQCEHALVTDPRNDTIWKAKGEMLEFNKQYEEALVAYEQAIHFLKEEFSMHPELASVIESNLHSALVQKGECLYTSGRYEEALTAYEEAIELDPNDADAYYHKGGALDHLERSEEALQAFEHAIELDPEEAHAYYRKGQILSKLKRNTEAQQAFDKARQLGYDIN